MSEKKIAIVGGGISGLFSAYLLTKWGYHVTLYEAKNQVGLKWLVAASSGINCSSTFPLDQFALRYFNHSKLFYSYLEIYGPKDLQEFFTELGCTIKFGSSHKILVEGSLSPKEILEQWLEKIKATNCFTLRLAHRLKDFVKTEAGFKLHFDVDTSQKKSQDKKEEPIFDSLVLALGGASYKNTGSDGAWKPMLQNMGIKVADFLPSNCGFHINYNSFLADYFCKHRYLKNCALCLDDSRVEIDGLNKIRGDITFTPFGVEGLLVYQLSRAIRNKIALSGSATLYIDFLPDYSIEQIYKKVGEGVGSKKSSSKWLASKLSLSQLAFTLIKNYLGSEFLEKLRVGKITRQELWAFKALPIKVDKPDLLERAISVAGGVDFKELNFNLMVKKIPGLFLAGEMLDFEAPTGGFLMQAAFSTAYIASLGVPEYLNPIKNEGGKTVV